VCDNMSSRRPRPRSADISDLEEKVTNWELGLINKVGITKAQDGDQKIEAQKASNRAGKKIPRPGFISCGRQLGQNRHQWRLNKIKEYNTIASNG